MKKHRQESELDNRQFDMTSEDFENVQLALNEASAFVIMNEEGKFLYANDKFCEISQYNRDEIIGKDLQSFQVKDALKTIWTTVECGQIWRGTLFQKAKDGSFYWLQATIVPFLNEKDQLHQMVLIGDDITERKQWEERVQKNERFYRFITEYTSDLITIIDREGDYLYASASHEKLLQYPLVEIEKSNIFSFIHRDDRAQVMEQLQQSSANPFEFRMRVKDGPFIYIEASVGFIEENESLVLVMRNITERKKEETHIYHLAFHDALTNLPNRRMFMKQLREEVAKAKETNKKLAVMFLDLDRFKDVNDTWGHDTGDYILTVAADRIKNILRSGDLIGRLGGDEFAIMLKEIEGEESVLAFTERLRNCFKKPIEVGKGQQYSLACSIGIALFPEHGSEAEQLLLNADTALYSVKGRGKNEHAIFTPEMVEKSLEHMLLENELSKALEKEQFYLDFQPKLDFVNGKVIGMEALIRWRHPDLGIIPPLQFIPLAEESGLILRIGEWVLQKACQQNKEWLDEGFPPLRVSVNLSTKQLVEPNFVSKVKAILEETQLDPNLLELEVTESVFADVEDAANILEEIRELGVHISIDDFGTGYSSLNYIKHLPVDMLKIDASFIRDIHENEESKAIVKAVLTLADTLGMKVLAEGIERKEQLKVLNEDGCKFGQGFLFSRPLSKDDFERFIKEGGYG